MIRIDNANIAFDESSEERKDDEKIIESVVVNAEKKRIEKGKEEILNLINKNNEKKQKLAIKLINMFKKSNGKNVK